MREEWLTTIETEVGFLHPIFTEIVDNLISEYIIGIDWYNENENMGFYSLPFSYTVKAVEASFEDDTYIAVQLPTTFLYANPNSVLLFRKVGEIETLLVDSRQLKDSRGIDLCCSAGFSEEPFADRNGNGYLDLAIYFGAGVSQTTVGIVLIELRPNQELVKLVNGISGQRVQFVDIEEDDILEIEAIQRVPIPDSLWNPEDYWQDYWIPRWYQWDGESYVPLPVFGDMDD